MSKGVTTSEGYHLQKSGDRVSTLLSRHYVVPTLASPPNENTLAWNDDSYMVNFRIGEFARVATDNGYLFYRLDDIAENKASWQELTSEDLSNYYTKDEINQLLSGLDPDIPQPDWNARKEEEGFIANRTHYYKTVTRIGTYQLASLNAGDILVSDLTDEAVYLIQNTAPHISNIEELIPTEGNRVAIPADGPTVYAVVTRDDEDKLNLVLENNYGISNYIKIEKAYIGKQLCERFLPEQIARTKDIDSVRNSIIGEDGYVYSNGEKVDMRFTRSLLPVGTSIPKNSNLNTIDYLKIGKYYCSLNVDAETITYCPVKVAFSMEVFNPLGTNIDDETTRDYTYRLRVVTQYDSGTQYLQFCKTSGTAGKWTYGDWYAAPRTKATLNSNKKGSTMTLGSGTQGVYVSSTGVLTKMTYTLEKSVPKNAVFTDTNTKVTSVENHYTPIEDEDSALETTDEVIIGIKRDATGHVVGIKSSPDFAKKSYVDDKFSNVSGGIRFKGVVTELPWEGYILELFDEPWDEEERKSKLLGYEVGDLIIVASKTDDMGDTLPDSTEEPAIEYILISESEALYNNGDDNIRYRWEDLGDCSVSDRKIVALEQKHDSQIAEKQDTLVSGVNIKTINGQSILGSGNINTKSEDSEYATEDYVNNAIADAITNVLNTPV